MGFQLGLAAPIGTAFHAPEYGRGTDGRMYRQTANVNYFFTASIKWNGTAPPKLPAKGEQKWRVGIVQNVLFDHIKIQYDGIPDRIPPFHSDKPVLDAGEGAPGKGDEGVPFYAPPSVLIHIGSEWYQVVYDFTLAADSPDGGGGVRIYEGARNRSFGDITSEVPEISIGFSDRPTTPAPDMMDGHPLMLIERGISLQFWIVALQEKMPAKEAVVLASSDPFTIVQWMDLSPAKGAKSTADAKFASYCYTLDGKLNTTTFPHAANEQDPQLASFRKQQAATLKKGRPGSGKMVPSGGQGAARPVLDGPLGNTQLREWATKYNLWDAPKPPTPGKPSKPK